jgi:hypothetical protein
MSMSMIYIAPTQYVTTSIGASDLHATRSSITLTDVKQKLPEAGKLDCSPQAYEF